MIEEKIKETLAEVRPLLALHRGDVDFVSFAQETGIVTVRLKGTCQGCPLSQLTLKGGIESLLKEKVVGVTSVEAI